MAATDAAPLPNWDTLTFSLTKTDRVFVSHGDPDRDPVWDAGEFLPFGDQPFSPGAACLSYGLGIFEGLKARRTRDDRILLFRADAHARRFRRSAERLMLLPYPPETFLTKLVELVRLNARFVPPPGKGALYVRPMEHGVDDKLGLGPSRRSRVTMYVSPVGGYFRASFDEGLKLKVVEQARVATGGIGAAKAMGNYGAAIPIAHEWKRKGFDDALFLDPAEHRYLSETSGANCFIMLRSGTLVTPPLDDQILPGVTRDSTLCIARRLLDMKVEERPISVQEVLEDAEEMFCSGTAYSLRSVQQISYREHTRTFEKTEARVALLEILRGIQRGERDDRFQWTLPV